MNKKKFAVALLLVMLASFSPIIHAEEVDTDGDGLTDIAEDKNGNGKHDEGETDLFNADTDKGGESDGSEVKAGRNPLVQTDDLTYDADGDGWVNGIELLRGTDPQKKDTDDDGFDDPVDPFPLQDEFKTDDDKDGIPDEWEDLTGLTSSGQTLETDPDQDGLTNAEELANGTDPLNADTDGDGVNDKDEIANGTNPRENACLSVVEPEPLFSDVLDHWSKEYVVKMRRTVTAPGDTPIIRGFVQGTGSIFLPDRPVTRYEFLKMTLLSTCTPLSDDSLDVDVRFSDINSIPQLNEDPDTTMRRRIIYTAVQKGIVQGYPDGTFKADNQVNRAEALKMIMAASRLKAPTEATNMSRQFTDVLESDWYKPFLSIALWFDLVGGYPDGTFGATLPITRAEATKILYRTMLTNPLVNGYVLPPI